MKKVFIIILNFNGGKNILECLDSIEQESKRIKEQEVEVMVVDNGSTDNSLQLIKEAFPKIKIIENKKNLGFAAGNNVGIRYTLKQKADAVLLLNQDTIAEKGFLELLFKNPADIVGPVIKFKRKGKWVYDFGGKINWWLGRPMHSEFSKLSVIRHALNKIDYISGCAMLIKRPVLKKIGLLDEKFFLYFEDVDFCLKAKGVGFKIAVEPKSIVFHKLVEGKKKPLKQQFNLLKSNFIFINQYVSFFKKPFAYTYLALLFIKVVLNQLK